MAATRFGGTFDSAVPVRDALSNHVAAVAASAGSEHSLARRANGGLLTWGANDRGQLGDATRSSPDQDPAPVVSFDGTNPSDRRARAIAPGDDHDLSVAAEDGSEGTVWAWGAGTLGQLGSGASGDSDVPLQVVTGDRRRDARPAVQWTGDRRWS